MSALAARVVRQQHQMTRVTLFGVKLKNKASAKALLTLCENTAMGRLYKLVLGGSIEEDGWAAVAEVLKLVVVYRMEILLPKAEALECLREARREDLRTIFKRMEFKRVLVDPLNSRSSLTLMALEQILDAA